MPSASSIPPASSPVLTVLASIVTSDPELGEPDEKTLITKSVTFAPEYVNLKSKKSRTPPTPLASPIKSTNSVILL